MSAKLPTLSQLKHISTKHNTGNITEELQRPGEMFRSIMQLVYDSWQDFSRDFSHNLTFYVLWCSGRSSFCYFCQRQSARQFWPLCEFTCVWAVNPVDLNLRVLLLQLGSETRNGVSISRSVGGIDVWLQHLMLAGEKIKRLLSAEPLLCETPQNS